jgi:hypothetical protein
VIFGVSIALPLNYTDSSRKVHRGQAHVLSPATLLQRFCLAAAHSLISIEHGALSLEYHLLSVEQSLQYERRNLISVEHGLPSFQSD